MVIKLLSGSHDSSINFGMVAEQNGLNSHPVELDGYDTSQLKSI